jgi:hypothetical protein
MLAILEHLVNDQGPKIRRYAKDILDNLEETYPTIYPLKIEKTEVVSASVREAAISSRGGGAGGSGSSAAAYKPALTISAVAVARDSESSPARETSDWLRKRREAEAEEAAGKRGEWRTWGREETNRRRAEYDAISDREAEAIAAVRAAEAREAEDREATRIELEARKADVSNAWDRDIDRVKADYHNRFGYDISDDGRRALEEEIKNLERRKSAEIRGIDGDSSVCSVM